MYQCEVCEGASFSVSGEAKASIREIAYEDSSNGQETDILDHVYGDVACEQETRAVEIAQLELQSLV